MQPFVRTLIAAASLALLASCATTDENAEEMPTETTDQQGVTAQPGQEAYSYAYGQAPGNYDTYDTSGTGGGRGNRGGQYGQGQAGAGQYNPGQSGSGQPGQYGQGQADSMIGGGNAVSADRIVYFDFDRSDIRADSRPVIERNARYLTSNPRIITQLEGHTDDRGSREYNIALGERRGNAVRQSMSAMGVSPQQIRVVSYGKERPASSGQGEQSHALNRRVEIMY